MGVFVTGLVKQKRPFTFTCFLSFPGSNFQSLFRTPFSPRGEERNALSCVFGFGLAQMKRFLPKQTLLQRHSVYIYRHMPEEEKEIQPFCRYLVTLGKMQVGENIRRNIYFSKAACTVLTQTLKPGWTIQNKYCTHPIIESFSHIPGFCQKTCYFCSAKTAILAAHTHFCTSN